jgi:uncharacterized membrane protein HdeD (DUF308 family)
VERASANRPREMLERVGASWMWVLLFGASTTLLGIIAVAWPDSTLVVIAILFGAQLVVSGIFRFVAAFAMDVGDAAVRVLQALLGLFSFIVGLYALRHVDVTLSALALVLGIFWIIHGFIELFTALSHHEIAARGWVIFTGILGILAGAVVLSQPGISLLTLTWVLGIWLIVLGISTIVGALRLRRVTRALT